MKWLAIAAVLIVSLNANAQTVQLPPWTHQQFLSATGAPLSAACIYTDSAGTTTPLATFTDATGLTANANPTQADAGGFVNLWLTSGVAYKFIVWSNPAGGACPGTPAGQMALQWTVDGITTATSSGSGAATSLTSAGANPASAGVIRLAKGEQICWRNNGNSANICVNTTTSSPVDQLTWSQGILLTEIAAPAGLAGSDLIWGDSTAHRFKMTNNAGTADVVSGAASTDTFTNKTFDTGGAGNVFKIAGTQVTAVGGGCPGNQFATNIAITAGSIAPTCLRPSAANLSDGTTGSGAVVLATSPALVTPTIGGTTITNVPYLVWSSFLNVANGTSLNVDLNDFVPQAPITIDEFTIVFYNSFWASCSPFPTFTVYDVTGASALVNLVTSGSGTPFNVTGPGLAVNVASGHRLGIRETNAGAGCTGNPTSIQFNVQYRMQ